MDGETEWFSKAYILVFLKFGHCGICKGCVKPNVALFILLLRKI